MNIAIVSGYVTINPSLRRTKAGKAVTDFDLAVNRHTSKGDETDFPTVIVWGQLAEWACGNLRKGQRVAVHGNLKTRVYEDGENHKHKSMEIIAEKIEFAGGKFEKATEAKTTENE